LKIIYLLNKIVCSVDIVTNLVVFVMLVMAVMVSWWAELGLSIDVEVNSVACHHLHNGDVEQTNKDVGSEPGHESNNNHRSHKTSDFFSVFGDVFHDEIEGEQVSANDGNLAQKYEDLGKHVGETELKAMLDVQKESIPS
jgi:hypothetical protein